VADNDYIEQLADALTARVHSFQTGTAVPPDILSIEAKLPAFEAAVLSRSAARPGAGASPIPGMDVADLRGADSAPQQSGLSAIFRAEADELMLRLRTHTAILVNKGAGASDTDTSAAREGALRVLHTIKGSARMAGSHAMADIAHQLETDVADLTDNKAFGLQLKQCLPELQATLTPIDLDTPSEVELSAAASASASAEAPVTAIELPTIAITAAPKSAAEAHQWSVDDTSLDQLLETGTMLVSRQARVDDRLAVLRDHIRDIQASADRLQRLAANNPAFDTVASRELVADIQVARRHLERTVGELKHTHGLASHAGTALHRSLVRSRLQTIDSLLPRLQATLGDALTVCHREASLLMNGGEVTVSTATLKSLAPLLEQLIRNSVAHGIGAPDDRLAEHKPVDGEIAITISVDGTDLLIDVNDDGDGIDEDALNERRQAANLAPIRDAAHLREVVCSPGYSTLADASPVAGRGQGLSMVLDGVEALSGELTLINDPGEGLTVRLRVPQQTVVTQSLVFGEGITLHAIPVNYVSAVVDFVAHADVVHHNDQEWPVCTLEQLFNVGHSRTVATRTVLLTVGTARLAMPVPHLDGYRELVVQELGPQLMSLDRYVGGAVLADGRQVLIVNMHRLIQQRAVAIQRGFSTSDAMQSEPVRSALIADDSVTMRVAGERLLQRLGFQVHTARDGLEALEFLRRGMPTVLLLDIEMPGADGFDVVRRFHAELVSTETPVIIISTRRGPLERQRARSLGIRHLIQKPYTETQLREALEAVGVLSTPKSVN